MRIDGMSNMRFRLFYTIYLLALAIGALIAVLAAILIFVNVGLQFVTGVVAFGAVVFIFMFFSGLGKFRRINREMKEYESKLK